MIITQGSTQPLVALHGQPAVDVPIPREQQDIALALVIALGMVVFDIFLEGPSQRTLAKEDHLAQALLVCTENLIRFDLMTESLSVARDDRADYPPLEPGRLALQAQELA